jgi:signal transduction histidine kinase
MSPVVGPRVTAQFVQPAKQEDLLATTCHKLRTPLTAAMGFLQLAVRDARRMGNVPSSHLEMVDQQLRRMASMLDELASETGSQ